MDKRSKVILVICIIIIVIAIGVITSYTLIKEKSISKNINNNVILVGYNQ